MLSKQAAEQLRKERVGQKFITNENYVIEIIQYNSSEGTVVKFENGYIVSTYYSNVKKGTIKNPYHPSLSGVGFIGVGKYKVKSGKKKTPSYDLWSRMLNRCYSKYQHPAYKGCSVSQEWHNYQVFAEWFENNHIDGWSLDKDIFSKGNKMYSPETCCFIPQWLNNLFTNVQSTNTSGYTGVHWHKEAKKWRASNSNGAIGDFDKKEEAALAYLEKRSEVLFLSRLRAEKEKVAHRVIKQFEKIIEANDSEIYKLKKIIGRC